MKKNISLTVLISCLFVNMAAAQAGPGLENIKVPNKQFYVECLGPGGILSVNFDSRFSSGTPLGWGCRAGIGFGLYTKDVIDAYNFIDTELSSYITFPVQINYIFGKRTSPHTFEVGAGATLMTREISIYTYNSHGKPGYFVGHMSFMYRRVPLNGGFTWRIGLTPIIGTSGDIYPLLAYGLGFSF